MRGHIDCLLAGCRIQHQKDLLRADFVFQLNQFLDQNFVDLKSSRSIVNKDVAALLGGMGLCLLRNDQHVLFPSTNQGGYLELFAKGFELIHGRRTIHISSHQHGLPTLLGQPFGQLATGSGFSGTVETHHHDTRWLGVNFQGSMRGSEQLNQCIVDDLDDLLTRVDALDDLLSDRLLLDIFNELFGHLEVHVGIQ